MRLQPILKRNTLKNRNFDKIAATAGAHVKAILDLIEAGKREKILLMVGKTNCNICSNYSY